MRIFTTNPVISICIILTFIFFSGIYAQGNNNWDTRFESLGLNGKVNAIAVKGNDVYVGGEFSEAGNISVNYIAKWNGTSWSALGSGLDSKVLAIAVHGNSVYVGGEFSEAGGETVNYVAKWNGSSWSDLNNGTDSKVYALAIDGNNLIIGGDFSSAGGVSANYIAKWNGNSWSALGSGMNGPVYAIAIKGNAVFAGGDYSSAGGINANRIAKWKGNNWSALGSGVDSKVYSIAVKGSNIYVAGEFTSAGGSSANYIAIWNGSSWSNLGSGMNSKIYSLAVGGNVVYAAGEFTSAGGNSADRIARWSGGSWSSLGSGINSQVMSIAVCQSENAIYTGGQFSSAGNNNSGNFGRWFESDFTLPVELVSLNAEMFNDEILLSWSTETETNNYGFEVEKLKDKIWKTIGFVEGSGNSNSIKNYKFSDKEIKSGENNYRLKQIDNDGSFTYSDQVEAFGTIVTDYELHQNFPNPFNPSTTIKYTLPEQSEIKIVVYNSIGKEINTLLNRTMEAGKHKTVWFAKDNKNNSLPSGVYFISLIGKSKNSGEEIRKTIKSILLK